MIPSGEPCFTHSLEVFVHFVHFFFWNVRYNIGYGAIGVKPEGPTMEDVMAAAKAAQIHNRIMSVGHSLQLAKVCQTYKIT